MRRGTIGRGSETRQIWFMAPLMFAMSRRAVIAKHIYNIYLLAYGLWWVSVFIIVANEGFHPQQDLPWFVLFTSVLIGLRWLKARFTGDNNWVMHKGASTAHKATYLGVFVIAAALMLTQ